MNNTKKTKSNDYKELKYLSVNFSLIYNNIFKKNIN